MSKSVIYFKQSNVALASDHVWEPDVIADCFIKAAGSSYNRGMSGNFFLENDGWLFVKYGMDDGDQNEIVYRYDESEGMIGIENTLNGSNTELSLQDFINNFSVEPRLIVLPAEPEINQNEIGAYYEIDDHDVLFGVKGESNEREVAQHFLNALDSENDKGFFKRFVEANIENSVFIASGKHQKNSNAISCRYDSDLDYINYMEPAKEGQDKGKTFLGRIGDFINKNLAINTTQYNGKIVSMRKALRLIKDEANDVENAYINLPIEDSVFKMRGLWNRVNEVLIHAAEKPDAQFIEAVNEIREKVLSHSVDFAHAYFVPINDPTPITQEEVDKWNQIHYPTINEALEQMSLEKGFGITIEDNAIRLIADTEQNENLYFTKENMAGLAHYLRQFGSIPRVFLSSINSDKQQVEIEMRGHKFLFDYDEEDGEIKLSRTEYNCEALAMANKHIGHGKFYEPALRNHISTMLKREANCNPDRFFESEMSMS
ncbi:hypothetical protein Q9L42_020190 (plasmid) [Methylomarinum sp. Ch1-1]|uniref:Uncharacterized protein n=1 Tax=Methylomarinum roseum TaxID=3067653 RepID=A0AAU7P016_9GAMM|nr:hypothetical protein [Methylomarinum sp. Ch1-1]MDP4523234.1 hypothetical protein [Methylomarinum sp. Ch1-1]